MGRFRLKFILVVFVSLLLFFPPKEVWAIYTSDRTLTYDRYILTGLIDLSYLTKKRKTDRGEETTNAFFQRYDLGLSGNLWDRKIFIFNTKASFVDKDRTSDIATLDEKTKIHKYRFKGTLFPKFWFPLTITLERETEDRNDNEKITNSAELRWLIRHYKFPKTDLKLKYATTDGSRTDSDRFSYSLTLNKRIINTTNELKYKGFKSDVITDKNQKTTLDFDTVTYRFGAKHRWWDTNVNVSTLYAKSNFESGNLTSGRESTVMRTSIRQQPHEKATHRFGYVFRLTETSQTTNEETTEHEFSTAFRQRVSKRLSFRESIRYRLEDTESTDLDRSRAIARVSGGAAYSIFEGLSFNGSIYYQQEDKEPKDILTGEERENEYGIDGGLEYSTAFKVWKLNMSGGYKIGYKRRETQFTSGEKDTRDKFPQELTFRVDVSEDADKVLNLKYISLTPSYQLDVGYDTVRRRETGSIDTFASDEARLASLDQLELEDVNEEDERLRHTFGLTLRKVGNYWRRTKFQSRLVHTITTSDNDFGGDTIHRTRVNGFINHDRIFRTRKFRGRLNGKLTLNARFNHFKTKDEDGDKVTEVFYTAQYLMSPIFRSRLTIDLEREEVYTKSKEEINHIIRGKFLYALGSWLLTVELSREYEGDTRRFDKAIEDRMFFQMTRYFGRVF